MKAPVSSLLRTLALLAAVSACRQTDASTSDLASIDPQLARIQREVWEAWFAGDTARLKEILPQELVAIGKDERGFAGLRDQVRASAGFQKSGGKLAGIAFPEMRIQHYGGVVITYSRYELALAFGKDTTRQAGRVTEVFVKRDGKWMNSAWHMD